jgi:molybdate transport system regulatory protein
MQKSADAPLPTLSSRIDLDSEGRIGPGKIQLLEKIRQFGSISAAGRAMDMCYKRAWDLVARSTASAASWPWSGRLAARTAGGDLPGILDQRDGDYCIVAL